MRQAIGVTMAGMLAAGAVLFGANKGKDTDTEAALQHALRPTMSRMARKIIGFAAEHPSLAHTSVKGDSVDLTVAASMKPEADARTQDTAFLQVIGPRRPGSKLPGADTAMAVFMMRGGQVRGTTDETYSQSIDLSATANPELTTGEAGSDAVGWAAQEHTAVTGGEHDQVIHINTADAADPAAAAIRVATDAPSVLGQVEADLRYAAGPGSHRLMP